MIPFAIRLIKCALKVYICIDCKLLYLIHINPQTDPLTYINTNLGWAQYCSRHDAVDELTKLTKKSRSSTTSLGDLRIRFKDKTKKSRSRSSLSTSSGPDAITFLLEQTVSSSSPFGKDATSAFLYLIEPTKLAVNRFS